VSETLIAVLIIVVPRILFFGLIFLLLKFVLIKIHDGMDSALDMSRKSIKMCEEQLVVQKELLSELREIKTLLEKR